MTTTSASEKAEKQQQIWTFARKCIELIGGDDELVREVAQAMLESIAPKTPLGPVCRTSVRVPKEFS